MAARSAAASRRALACWVAMPLTSATAIVATAAVVFMLINESAPIVATTGRPEDTTAPVTAAARPAGAAAAEWLPSSVAKATAVEVTPRRPRRSCSFSSARSTRLCAVASVSRKRVAISAKGRCSKKRKSTASRSLAFSSSRTSSITGRSRSHSAGFDAPAEAFVTSCMRCAAVSRARRRRSVRRISATLKRVVACNQPARLGWPVSVRARSASSRKTPCATSPARCASAPSCRAAAW